MRKIVNKNRKLKHFLFSVPKATLELSPSIILVLNEVSSSIKCQVYGPYIQYATLLRRIIEDDPPSEQADIQIAPCHMNQIRARIEF